MDYEKRKKKYIIAAAVIVGLALLGIIIWLIVKYTRKDKNGGNNDDDPCNNHPCSPSKNCHPTPGSKPGYKCSPTAHPDPCVGIDCNKPHGDCVKGKCECKEGWTGTECKTPPVKPGANRYSCTGPNGECVPTTKTGAGTYITSNCGSRCSSQSRRYICDDKSQRCSPTAATGTSTYESEYDCNHHCKAPDPPPTGDGPLFGYWYTSYCTKSSGDCPALLANASLNPPAQQWGCVAINLPDAQIHVDAGSTPQQLVELKDLLDIINDNYKTTYQENTTANLGIGTPNTMQTVGMTAGTWGQKWSEADDIQIDEVKDKQSCFGTITYAPEQCGYHLYKYGPQTLCGQSNAAKTASGGKPFPNNIMNIGGWGALYNANEQNTPIAWSDASIPDPDKPDVILDALSAGGYNGISFDIEGILPSAKDAMIKKLNKLLPLLYNQTLKSGKKVDYVWIVIPGNNVSPSFGGPLRFGKGGTWVNPVTKKKEPAVNIDYITHVQLMFYGAGNDSIYGGDFSQCYTPTAQNPGQTAKTISSADCKGLLNKYGTPSSSFKPNDDHNWVTAIKSLGLPANKVMSAWSFNKNTSIDEIKPIIKDVWEVANGGLFVWCKGQEMTFKWDSPDGYFAQCNGYTPGPDPNGGGGNECDPIRGGWCGDQSKVDLCTKCGGTCTVGSSCVGSK